MLYDTHAHLNTELFADNYSLMIKEANDMLVYYINVVGFDPETNRIARKIAKEYPGLYASCGLHPSEVDRFSEQDLQELEQDLQSDIVVAVGECGLDYYWNQDNKEKQKLFFKAQIELSKKYHKPLIIHVRDAFQDAYDLLKEASLDHKLQGVMHCYSGSKEMAQLFIDLGLYISLAGPVTFKNAVQPKEVAKSVPIDKLLIETDSPYLAPHPNRGKQNQPSWVVLIAQEIAKLRGISVEELGEKTTENGKRLFHIT